MLGGVFWAPVVKPLKWSVYGGRRRRRSRRRRSRKECKRRLLRRRKRKRGLHQRPFY